MATIPLEQFLTGGSVDTDDASVTVEINPARPLKPGRHRFELRVVDDDGLVSDPSICELIVKDDRRPTAVINCIPEQVTIGKGFELSGRGSSDMDPGSVVKYSWKMIS